MSNIFKQLISVIQTALPCIDKIIKESSI